MSKMMAYLTRRLREEEAAWCVTAAKCVLPDDGYEAKPTYHIHPNQSHPHQDDVLRFRTLAEIKMWLDEPEEWREINGLED